MFRMSTAPIIRSTQNSNYSLRYWSYFLCSYLSPTWPSPNLATLEGGSCTVPEDVVTVLCTADDGCGWHPKDVEWTCIIIDCFVLNLVWQLLIHSFTLQRVSSVRRYEHRTVQLSFRGSSRSFELVFFNLPIMEKRFSRISQTYTSHFIRFLHGRRLSDCSLRHLLYPVAQCFGVKKWIHVYNRRYLSMFHTESNRI